MSVSHIQGHFGLKKKVLVHGWKCSGNKTKGISSWEFREMRETKYVLVLFLFNPMHIFILRGNINGEKYLEKKKKKLPELANAET